MTFIDWSDPEGMFDLFIEFIRDEMNDSSGDTVRQQFLGNLLTKVTAALDAAASDDASSDAVAQNLLPSDAVKLLSAIQDTIDEEFKNDPVVLHITDFINELERL